MDRRLPVLAALLSFAVAACSTPQARVQANQAAFDSYTPEVQQKIRTGSIDIGFTPEQVQMALGEPDHRSSRQTAGETLDVWGYRDSRPVFSFGLGGAGFGGSSAVGGGIGVSTGSDNSDDKTRVIFKAGKVMSIERQVSQ